MAKSTFAKIAKSCEDMYKQTMKGRSLLERVLGFDTFKKFPLLKNKNPTAMDIFSTDYVNQFVTFRNMSATTIVMEHVRNGGKLPEEAKRLETALAESELHMYVFSRWVSYGRKCFKFGREFSTELEKVDLKVTGDSLLKDGNRGFFLEFPKPFRDKSDAYFGAFVTVETKESITKNKSVPVVMDSLESHMKAMELLVGQDELKINEYRERVLLNNEHTNDLNRIFVVAPYFADGDMSFAFRHIRIDNESLEESLSVQIDEGIPNHMMSYILKAALYIASGDPDLRELRPDKMTKAERKQFEKEHDSAADIPMTLVSWGWKKPVHYNTGVWSQAGHFRWQPYGAGRAQVKLIWVEEQLKQRRVNED